MLLSVTDIRTVPKIKNLTAYLYYIKCVILKPFFSRLRTWEWCQLMPLLHNIVLKSEPCSKAGWKRNKIAADGRRGWKSNDHFLVDVNLYKNNSKVFKNKLP